MQISTLCIKPNIPPLSVFSRERQAFQNNLIELATHRRKRDGWVVGLEFATGFLSCRGEKFLQLYKISTVN